ncbi:hypothetical protein AB395_00002300 [Sinorhizobium fredii CCBAU 45436]|nr:hypothetical protein AB395_00002300 [Sinorhizobium fredii CCBAU 45436]
MDIRVRVALKVVDTVKRNSIILRAAFFLGAKLERLAR